MVSRMRLTPRKGALSIRGIVPPSRPLTAGTSALHVGRASRLGGVVDVNRSLLRTPYYVRRENSTKSRRQRQLNMAMSENKQKMLKGELYYSFTPELLQERTRAKHACHKYNTTGEMTRRQQVELWRS